MAQTQSKITVPEKPIIIGTAKTDRPVLVVGANLVPVEFIQIMGELLDPPDVANENVLPHEVGMVRFRTDVYPKDPETLELIPACYEPWSGSITINLKAAVLNARRIAKGPDNRASLELTIWHNLICKVLHETFHSYQTIKKIEAGLPVVFDQEDEDMAEAFAYDKSIEMAKTIRMEMPERHDWGWFTGYIEEWYKHLKDQPYAGLHQMMRNNGLIYYAPEDLTEVHSFREMMNMLAGADVYDSTPEAWHPDNEKEPETSLFLVMTEEEVSKLSTPVATEVADIVIESALAEDIPEAPVEETVEVDDVPETPAAEDVPDVPDAPSGAEDAGVEEFISAANATDVPEPPGFEERTPSPNRAPRPSAGPSGVSAPPHDLPVNQVANIMKQIWMHLFRTIFTKCGFDPSLPKGFANPYAVMEPVDFSYISGADKVLTTMTCQDANGVFRVDMPVQGAVVKGHVKDKKKDGNPSMMPCFQIGINDGSGKVWKRIIMPQNPATTSKSAALARTGHKIAWIMEDVPPGQKSRFLGKVDIPPGQQFINFTWF